MKTGARAALSAFMLAHFTLSASPSELTLRDIIQLSLSIAKENALVALYAPLHVLMSL